MGEEEEVIDELPKTIVREVVDDMLFLSSISTETNLSLHNDELLAFSEAGRVFIHHLSAVANEIRMELKRKTINAEDVMIAIEVIGFSEFLGPLRDSLEDFQRKNPKKRAGTAKAKQVSKKKKDDFPLPTAPEKGTHTEDVVKEGNNNNKTATDRELQHNSVDERQNAAVEEEKSSKDATDNEQNDEDNVSKTAVNHEPDEGIA